MIKMYQQAFIEKDPSVAEITNEKMLDILNNREIEIKTKRARNFTPTKTLRSNEKSTMLMLKAEHYTVKPFFSYVYPKGSLHRCQRFHVQKCS